MAGLDAAEKVAAKAIHFVETEPALMREIESLLGRTPLKSLGAGSLSLFDSEAPAAIAAGDHVERVLSKGIPALEGDFLPAGVHTARWDDVIERYGADPNRSKFFPGMLHALHDLKEGGVEKAYLGGSFITSKIKPNDFDISFSGNFGEHAPRAYTQVLGNRDLMKKTYGGEMLHDHLDFFKQARGGKRDIGVLKLELDSLPPRADRSPAYSIYDDWLRTNSKRTTLIDRMRNPVELPQHEDFFMFDDVH